MESACDIFYGIHPRYTQDSVIKQVDCVRLGMACAEVCQVLGRGIGGGWQEQLSQSVLGAIERLKA